MSAPRDPHRWPEPPGNGAEADRVWTVLSLLQWTTGPLRARRASTVRASTPSACSLTPWGWSACSLYVDFDKPVTPEAERAGFRELVKRRAGERIPVSQLLGSKEFWSLEPAW